MMSEYESASEDERVVSRIDREVDNLLNMRPEYSNRPKSKAKSYKDLRIMLETDKKKPVNKPLTRSSDRKNIEDCFRDLQTDIRSLSDKFNAVYQVIGSILDRMEAIEAQVQKLQSPEVKNSETPSYAEVVKSDEGERLERLEYIASEEERRNRLNQISITHSSLDSSSDSLNSDMKNFLKRIMKLDEDSIDDNLICRKTSKPNTVIVTFSQRKFKLGLFRSKKTMRLEGSSSYKDLYINDNLTPYNFKLLMSIKSERTRRSNGDLKSFDTIYTHEGRVFVKISKSGDKKSAIHIRTRSIFCNFLRDLDKSSSNEQVTSNSAAV